MQSYYAMLALDLANERARQADEQRRTRMLLAGLPDRPSILRSALAHGTAAISRGAAAATRRLDACVADDLGRSIAVGN